MKGDMWQVGSCNYADYDNKSECNDYMGPDNLVSDNNPDTPDDNALDDDNGLWADGQYQTDKNNSLYAKFEIDTSSIPKVQIAEVFYQQTNSDKPFNFKPNENTLIGYNIGIDLSDNMIVVLKGRKSYEFDGDGYKAVHSTQIETSVYF